MLESSRSKWMRPVTTSRTWTSNLAQQGCFRQENKKSDGPQDKAVNKNQFYEEFEALQGTVWSLHSSWYWIDFILPDICSKPFRWGSFRLSNWLITHQTSKINRPALNNRWYGVVYPNSETEFKSGKGRSESQPTVSNLASLWALLCHGDRVCHQSVMYD